MEYLISNKVNNDELKIMMIDTEGYGNELNGESWQEFIIENMQNRVTLIH
jgi:septin family protein